MLYPETFWLSFQESSTLCCGGAAPAPASVMTGELEASLATASVADAFPLALGANVTVKEALCPAGTTTGRAGPLMEYSDVLGASEEIVTFDPEALSFRLSCSVVPTVTLPKLRPAGLSASCPTDVPLPASAIVRFATPAFEVITRLPLAAPVVCGANCTPKVKL